MLETKQVLAFFVTPLHRKKVLIGLGLLVLLTGALVFVGRHALPRLLFSSADITGSDFAQTFELTDHYGKTRRLSDFEGKIVVLFFGYTQCPDVCPTSMSTMARIKSELGKDSERLQLLFVTVDPDRDTQEVLKAYMENFDPTFLALIPTTKGLPQVAREFQVFYQRVEGSTPTSYTMDHTASSYIYDLQGRLRLLAPYGMDEKALLRDIKQLIQEGSLSPQG